MTEIEAILFCGGRGTRLYPVTDYYQKVMMPIGPAKKPILDYIIRYLAEYGITKITALIRYRANQIRRYFGDGSNFGVSIEYVLDDPNFKGTGGALYNAKRFVDRDNILIYYTDILSNLNLHEFIKFHLDHGKIGTAWIDPSWQIEEGIVQREKSNKVVSIQNAPNTNIFANTGVSILRNSVFDEIEEYVNKGIYDIDLSGMIFPKLADKQQMKAYLSNDWWIDVGSLNRHQKAEAGDLIAYLENGVQQN